MILYVSRTGNVRNIISRLDNDIPCAEIKNILEVDSPYILCTYTDGLGDLPSLVKDFLEKNHTYCKGVVASGNTNFGQNFCGSAEKAKAIYGIPIIRKIDLRGTSKDIQAIEFAYKTLIKGDA